MILLAPTTGFRPVFFYWPIYPFGRVIQLHIKAGYIPGLVTSSLQYLGVRYLAQGYLGVTSTTYCILCLNWEPSTSTDWATKRVMSGGPLTRFIRVLHECRAHIIMCGYKLPPFQNKRSIFGLVWSLNMHMFRCFGTSKRCNFLSQ